MNTGKVILVPVVALVWACLAQAAAPSAAWTVRQNFPVNRDTRINASAADAQGNLYLAGSVENGANEDYYVCKIDGATDSIIWSAVYNGPDDDLDQATGCCLDSSGNLFVTGFSHNGTDFDALTIRYDAATGAEGWVKRYNKGVSTNEYVSSCAADRFGNVYIAGTYTEDTLYAHYVYGYGYYHAFVMKYNGASGDTVWSHLFNDITDSLSEANDCCVDDSGNIFIVGSASPGLDQNWWPITPYSLAVKMKAANGDTVWFKKYTPTGCETAYNCCLDASGNLVVVGSGGDYVYPDTIRIYRYNSANGDSIWAKSWADHKYPQDCAMASDNSLLVSAIGYDGYSGQYQNTVYMRVLSTGDSLWSLSLPITDEKLPLSLAVKDHNVFYASSTKAIQNTYMPLQHCYELFTARYLSDNGEVIDSISLGQSSTGGWNFAYDCAVSGNNGPVVAGSAVTFYAVMRYDPTDGHVIWEKRDPDPYRPSHDLNSQATGVAQAGDQIYTTGNAGAGFLTYKFDKTTGDTLWSKYSGYGLPLAEPGGCTLDQAGNMFITGNSNDYGDINSVVVKFSPTTGDTLWTSISSNFLWSNDCTVDSFGAFYDLGHYNNNNYIIVKHDNDTGDTLWTREFNLFGTGLEDAQGVCYSNGFLYVAGATYNGSSLDYFLAKHDTADGDTVWCRRFDGPYHKEDRAGSCAADDSGFIYLTGTSYNGADYDIWTMKCGPDGDSLWTVRYNSPDGKNDFGKGCCVDSLGYLYVTGFSATGRGYDMVTIKYSTGHTGIAGGLPATHDGRYFLGGVYPNPSPGGRITLGYELPTAGPAAFAVYNIAGQLVRTLDQGKQPGGVHKMIWDGTDRQGARVASGVYLVRCDLGGLSATRKVLVVR